MKFKRSKKDPRFEKFKKNIKTASHGGRVVIAPYGYHSGLGGSSLTGDLAGYHIEGKGNNPVRDFLGFHPLDIKYMRRQWRLFMAGRQTYSATLENIGEYVTRKIRLRTVKGQDAKGRAFKSYSEGYKKWKRKKGKSSKVNLTFEGIMMESLSYKVYNK